jgi:septum formation protein
MSDPEPTTSDAPPALFIVLASRSPQRAAILRQLGVSFRVAPSNHDESLLHGDPVSTVVGNAVGKADEVAGRERRELAPGHLVLGVDTVVVLGGRVLGKAADQHEAVAYVTELSGRTHHVYSGLCLRDREGRRWTGHARTAVTLRALAPGAVASYVATGEWRERAGAYAIQGFGSALVTAVDGDYGNVVGLPVALLLDGLADFGHGPFSWLTAASVER